MLRALAYSTSVVVHQHYCLSCAACCQQLRRHINVFSELLNNRLTDQKDGWLQAIEAQMRNVARNQLTPIFLAGEQYQGRHEDRVEHVGGLFNAQQDQLFNNLEGELHTFEHL